MIDEFKFINNSQFREIIIFNLLFLRKLIFILLLKKKHSYFYKGYNQIN